jgi:hypothetical protein
MDEPAPGPAPSDDIIENAPSRTWTRWAKPVGLLAGGALIGGVLAATLNAGAAPSPTPSPTSPPGYAMPHPGHPFGGHGFRGHMLNQTGTVTKVSTSSVTIKTSAATTTYAVNSKSDIDKNGEAKLSDLKVGDAVRFSVVTVNGKPTIAILHAGNEALNMPRHGNGDCPGMGGTSPNGGSSGTPNGGSSGTPNGGTSGSSTGFTNA